MPKVATILSDESVRTGGTGPLAPEGAFSVDTSGVAQGLQNVAGGLQSAAGDIQLLQNTKKAKYESDWATQSIEQEKRTMSEWLADPKNHTSQTFAQDFLEFSKTRVEEYDQVKEVSPSAKRALKQHLGSYITQKYDDALYTTEQNKLTNSVNSVATQISDATAAYRSARAIPNNDATWDLETSFDIIKGNLEESFKGAPKLIGRMKEQLATSFVYATMSDSPDVARRFLDRSGDIDEQTRKTLSSQIDAAEKHYSVILRDQFDTQRKNTIVATETGKNRDKIPLKDYQLFYPDEHAVVLKTHDDAQIDSLNNANDFVVRVSDKNPQSQMSELKKMYDDVDTEVKKESFKIAQQRVNKNLEMLDKDRVGYMMSNNGELKMLQERIASSGDKQGAMRQLNDAILKYQGPAPAGLPKEESDRYLDLPLNDRHLLSSPVAESLAADINKESPGNALKKMQETLISYDDPNHQMIALADLVTLPKNGSGLRQDYQLVLQNKDQWWIDTLIGALQNGKPLASLSDERRSKMEQLMDANKTWNQFSHSMIGDNFQRAKQIDGFKAGIMTYAHALEMQGKTIEQAIPEAIRMTLSSTLGFTSVNGQTLTVPRQAGKVERDDATISDIGRRLSYALQYVDPHDLSTKNFAFLDRLPDEVSKSQQLRNVITQRGFFQPSHDGQSVSLYLKDDKGFPFQATDKSGNPLVIYYDDLPEFIGINPSSFNLMLGPGYSPTINKENKFPQQPQKTYPLMQKPPGITNWPVRVPWIKNK